MEPLAFGRCLETFTIEVDVGNWILVSDITFGAKSRQSFPPCSMYFRILGFRFILLWLAIVFNLIVFTLLLNFHIQNVSTCGSLTRKIQ
jgi:hypothetical protein